VNLKGRPRTRRCQILDDARGEFVGRRGGVSTDGVANLRFVKLRERKRSGDSIGCKDLSLRNKTRKKLRLEKEHERHKRQPTKSLRTRERERFASGRGKGFPLRTGGSGGGGEGRLHLARHLVLGTVNLNNHPVLKITWGQRWDLGWMLSSNKNKTQTKEVNMDHEEESLEG